MNQKQYSNVPSVAIITRTKDRPLMLERAIGSVLSQTFEQWVHVIVNDGGRSEEVDTILHAHKQEYAGRVRVIHNAHSIGMQNASNAGISESSSKYVVIHDDDDTWQPEFLDECVGYLEDKGEESPYQGVITHVSWIIEEMDAWGTIVRLSESPYFPLDQVNLMEMASQNRFPPIAFVFRRSVHQEIGMFDQAFDVMGDWDFNLRFLTKYEIGVIPKQLAGYHWRKQQSDSVYANTVTSGLNIHHQKTNEMMNSYLRKDLHEGRLGLGHLMNVSRQNTSVLEEMQKITAKQFEFSRNHGYTTSLVEHLVRVTADFARLAKAKGLIRQIGGTCLALAQRGSSRFSSNGKGVLPEPGLPEKLSTVTKALEETELLSLDVFDTALHRLVRQPIDVFLFMEPAVKERLGRDEIAFTQIRVFAERIARKRAASRNGGGEVSLEQIYDVVSEIAEIDEDSAKEIMLLEIENEKRLCFPDPYILRLCREAEQRNIPVVFCSDMYLPSLVLRDLLKKNGYSPKTILVSCEEGATKHAGELYDRLLLHAGSSTERILHVGDNAHSDDSMAQKKGINSAHWTTPEESLPLVDQHTALSGSPEGDMASSLYTGCVRRYRMHQESRHYSGSEDPFWESLGYEVIGPLYLSFVNWVIHNALEKDIDKVFFLARDGYYLIKVFRMLSKAMGLSIDAEYMYASRRLLNLPSISELDEDSMQFLVTPNPFLTVKHFFERIGLDAEQHRMEIRASGFPSPDEIVTTQNGVFKDEQCHRNMKALMLKLEEAIVKRAAEERSTLEKYFESIGFPGNHAGIVDIGWQASSITALRSLVKRVGHSPHITGLYFATNHFAEKAKKAHCEFTSFYAHCGEPSFRHSLVSECPELLEFFFCAPHPTALALENKGSGFSPVYDSWDISEEHRSCLEKARQAGVEFVRDMLSVHSRLAELQAFGQGYLDCVMERLLRFPDAEQAKRLGELTHRDGFGCASPPRTLAKPPGILKRTAQQDDLRAHYEKAYWKKGFIALLPPEQHHLLS